MPARSAPRCLEYRRWLVLTLIAAAGLQAGAGGPVHAGGPAQALEDADDGGEISICRGSAPRRTQAGSEWRMLCQLSPSESRASGHKLVARSWRRVVNGRAPTTWHTELTLQVTCCSQVTGP